MPRPVSIRTVRRRSQLVCRWLPLAWLIAGSSLLQGQMLPLPLTARDFQVPGTQVGDVEMGSWPDSNQCSACHANYGGSAEPHSTWSGSLMALGGRDPLFYAQMTTANQDVAEVGRYCLRCHVPNAVVSGHVEQADGGSLDDFDREGVSCQFCHRMVDPDYKPGISPVEDEAILAGLNEIPGAIGNAMFVLDPLDRRRGPYEDNDANHATLASPFHRSSSMCGTCHDVGNVATTRQADGSYTYNALDTPAPDDDPWTHFPLERTYTEWKLSAFAAGVDMGGRFGGLRGPVVSTCQDCHMPTEVGRGCSFGRERNDLGSHAFAGAAVNSLDLIAAHTEDDPSVDQQAIAAGRERALDMLQRAADLELELAGGDIIARITNQSGHKLPTGHIEGRRVWLNLRYLDVQGGLLLEHGHYDQANGHLDEVSTVVFEMLVGLSDAAAAATGLTAGPTSRMALADTIVKDNRIPPRGYDPVSFATGGAPAVGYDYQPGQHWYEFCSALPAAATHVEATLYYQSLPRHYVEHLRDANTTNDWGDRLYAMYEQSGSGAPVPMVRTRLALGDRLLTDGFED
jgi:hypothetical protein